MFKVSTSFIVLVTFTVLNCYSQADTFQSSKKYLQLDTGIKMAYIEKGPANSEAIILMHGYTDSSRSFQFVIEELHRLNPQSRIILPDLRGHGRSGLPKSRDAFTLLDFTNDILDLMKQLNVERVHLVGHSFGSIVAQSIGLRHPEQVKSLILMGTFVNGRKNAVVQEYLINELVLGEWKSQLQKDYGYDWNSKIFELTPSDMGEHVELFLKENWVTEARADASYLNLIYEETIKTSLATWFETLNTLSKFDHSSMLSHLQIPTLILWGEDDDITPEHPDQQDLKFALQQAEDNLHTPIFNKTYRKNEVNDLKIGHNFHWAFPKEVAADIFMFTQNMAIDPSVGNEANQIKK